MASSPSLVASMKRNAASCVSSAAAIATGLNKMSPPRMLNSHATYLTKDKREEEEEEEEEEHGCANTICGAISQMRNSTQ